KTVLDPTTLVVDGHLVADVADTRVVHPPRVALLGADDLRIEPVPFGGEGAHHDAGLVVVLVDHGKGVVDHPLLAVDNDATLTTHGDHGATGLHCDPLPLPCRGPGLSALVPGISLPLTGEAAEHAEGIVLSGKRGAQQD